MSTTHTIPVNRTVYREQKIHIIECAHCAIDFGIGADFMKRRRDDHGTFYCPNGHRNVYSGANAEEKLREQLKRANERSQQNLEYADRERSRRLAAERSASARKGVITRMKNRISKGVCPCCSRSFPNLRAHMSTQHPTWADEHPDLAKDVR